jgi:hypothetical protein
MPWTGCWTVANAWASTEHRRPVRGGAVLCVRVRSGGAVAAVPALGETADATAPRVPGARSPPLRAAALIS